MVWVGGWRGTHLVPGYMEVRGRSPFSRAARRPTYLTGTPESRSRLTAGRNSSARTSRPARTCPVQSFQWTGWDRPGAARATYFSLHAPNHDQYYLSPPNLFLLCFCLKPSLSPFTRNQPQRDSRSCGPCLSKCVEGDSVGTDRRCNQPQRDSRSCGPCLSKCVEGDSVGTDRRCNQPQCDSRSCGPCLSKCVEGDSVGT
ncbi:hypothetical protein J6590_056933 [Homalodisca vitripennis]|nr:hypothetical protein J6590_056933 [Homalodisca vitripennis]